MASDADVARKVDRVARECLGMRARLLDRAITGIYAAALEGLDLKLSQLNVLVAVAKLAPARPADVAWALHLDLSTLSRNAERLRERGLVAVGTGEDARSRRYSLTAGGRALLEEAYPRWQTAQRRARRVLGADGAAALLEFARRRPFEAD